MTLTSTLSKNAPQPSFLPPSFLVGADGSSHRLPCAGGWASRRRSSGKAGNQDWFLQTQKMITPGSTLSRALPDSDPATIPSPCCRPCSKGFHTHDNGCIPESLTWGQSARCLGSRGCLESGERGRCEWSVSQRNLVSSWSAFSRRPCSKCLGQFRWIHLYLIQ